MFGLFANEVVNLASVKLTFGYESLIAALIKSSLFVSCPPQGVDTY
jgi:hypothetical protein